jgi:small subunit ribosomal protein S6
LKVCKVESRKPNRGEAELDKAGGRIKVESQKVPSFFAVNQKLHTFAVDFLITKFIYMLNQYETVFICTPVLSESQMKEAVSKFKKVITDGKGEIVYEEDWGLKKLAYPIQKKSTGFYHLIEFKADPSLIEKLETEFRRDERIIRFLTMKMEKYAVAYAEKKRARKSAELKQEGE